MDQRRIARETLRGCHVLDPMPLPQPIGTAEGRKTAFGRNAGAGQDDDIADVHRAQPSAAVAMSEAQDPHRHRRLDLPAVARHLLSRTSCRNRKSSNMRSSQFGAIEINATFYGRQKPEELGGVGEGRPGRVPVRGQGLALFASCRPKLADAGEGLGGFFAQGIRRTSGRSSARSFGSCSRVASSTAKTSPAFIELLPSNARRHSAPPCDRAAARKLSRREVLRAVPRPRTSRSSSRIRRRISVHRSRHRGLRLCAAPADARGKSRPAMTTARSTALPTTRARLARRRPRRLHLHDQRRQSPRARRCSGPSATPRCLICVNHKIAALQPLGTTPRFAGVTACTATPFLVKREHGGFRL